MNNDDEEDAEQLELTERNQESQREILIGQLLQDNVECIICCCIIRKEIATWSCDVCFNIFHLYCVKKWGSSKDRSFKMKADRWNCPTCHTAIEGKLDKYLCFCGKQRDPVYRPGTVPHSCNEPCRKYRNRKNPKCTHPCDELCHPGPCPSCQTFVTISCYCGCQERQQQCCNIDSNVDGYSCGGLCGRKLSCGNHQCMQPCHDGDCLECKEVITTECFSHYIRKDVQCKPGVQLQNSCGDVCGKLLECRNHYCGEVCHDGECKTCPYSPETVQTCHCGRHTLESLGMTRLSCEDKIPSCGNVCGKELQCGPPDYRHTCETLCHEGACVCLKDTQIRCKCRKRRFLEVPCQELERDYRLGKDGLYTFDCEQTCGIRKSCGRHKCRNKCCDLETHDCDLMCGKTLACGKHQCMETCHGGPCQTCRTASFDDWVCLCGRTMLPAPIPCGTKLPVCRSVCTRQHDCDHKVLHNCHTDDDCPPCAFLVSKTCMCGKTTQRNIQCFLKDVSCGAVCGKTLPCGVHTCKRTCHKDECADKDFVCKELCTMIRRACEHICGLPCHRLSDCPESVCQQLITISCNCGRLKDQVICSIKSQPKSRKEDLKDSMFQQSLLIPGSRAIADSPRLQCDSECRHLERLQKMASALKIADSPKTSAVLGHVAEFTEAIKDRARSVGLTFVRSIEEKLTLLVNETILLKKKVHTYRMVPMSGHKRQFVHELATYYGCVTSVEGQLSNRYVVVDSQFGYCWVPARNLSDIISYEKRVPPPASGYIPPSTLSNHRQDQS